MSGRPPELLTLDVLSGAPARGTIGCVEDHGRLQTHAHEHLLLHFARNGAFGPDGRELLVLDRGEGVHVYDTRGRRYIDGLSSLFCAQIGYSYGAEMAAVASDQL